MPLQLGEYFDNRESKVIEILPEEIRLFGPSTYQDIVAKIRKDLLNEVLGIG